ncbi:GNAT family N-acetyltransferase [Aspergillus undulatus]|uniref:GNAT family N-acetyltransferase n=1 Tax=Aspergillus undulatus TaxID=1810928 RepID=UPI003CCCD134
MPFTYTIQPLLPPDYVEAFSVADAAFADLNSLLYTKYPPSLKSKANLTKARLKAIKTMREATMFKAVDDYTKRIVGVARWVVATEDEEVEESIDDFVDDIMKRSVPETNKYAMRSFYRMATKGKWDILGLQDRNGDVVRLRRRVELETLVTHPEYQGKGVASALLQWGIDEADRLNLMVYLEATEAGKPLYKRFGFDTVHEMDFDAAEYGGIGKQRYTFMIRYPKDDQV